MTELQTPSRIYRYRCIYDEKFSSIPYGEWEYCDYNKFKEIQEGIERGNKYQLQSFYLTYNKLPEDFNYDH